MGTGGAVIKALRELKNKKCSIVMNGDTYFPISIDNLLAFHSEAHAAISIALFKSDDHSRYSGFAVDPIKRLITYVDPNSEYKSGGIYVFGELAIEWLLKQKIRNMSFETDLTPGFFARGMTIGAYTETVEFLDIGLPDDYRFAQQYLATVADQKFGGNLIE